MPPKISLFYETDEQYSIYGMEHFAKKYGLVSVADKQTADIIISYSVPENITNKVHIILFIAETHNNCYLTIEGETFPLFVKPIEQTDGQLRWNVLCEDNEYTCLSILNNIIGIGFDFFKETGMFLAGCYDEYFLQKDELVAKFRSVPVVDILEDALFSAINNVIPETIQRFTWPDNHDFALVLTHDVDWVDKSYQYLISIWNSLKKANISELVYHLKNLIFKHGKRNPYWTFSEICALENHLGVKSTYFFLNEKGNKHSPFSLESWFLYHGLYDIESAIIIEIIRWLIENGFEIGVHGSYNSYIDIGLLQSEKKTLESISGLEVNGIRQHCLNYDPDITPKIHNQSKFKYDTSISYIPETGMGFRRGTSFPFKIMLPDLSISPLLEIPLIIIDAAAKPGECCKIIEQVHKYHGVLTILWHSHKFNEHEYPGMTKIYEDLISECRARNAWTATATEVYEWIMRVK